MLSFFKVCTSGKIFAQLGVKIKRNAADRSLMSNVNHFATGGADVSHIIHRNLRQAPPVAVSAQGMLVRDSRGNTYIDASGGAAVSSLGHGHPDMIAAMHRQIDRLAYAHTAFFTTEAAEELADAAGGRRAGRHERGVLRLGRLGGDGDGAEAGAPVFRRRRTSRERSMFIARRQSYHGNTLGALAVGGNEFRRRQFAPLLIDVPRVAPCYEYRDRAERPEPRRVHRRACCGNSKRRSSRPARKR